MRRKKAKPTEVEEPRYEILHVVHVADYAQFNDLVESLRHQLAEKTANESQLRMLLRNALAQLEAAHGAMKTTSSDYRRLILQSAAILDLTQSPMKREHILAEAVEKFFDPEPGAQT